MSFIDRSPEADWPRDMAISVAQPSTLYLLLFVRSAWGLDDNGVPLLDVEPAPGTTAPPAGFDRPAANARWADDWARAFEAVVPSIARTSGPDAATRELLDGDSSLDELMHAVSTEAFWRIGLDLEAEWEWRRDPPRPWRPGSLSPEHDVVEWLVPVWRTGLTTIVELPFAGYYATRIGRRHAVISRVTRRDPELYSIALSTF